MKGQQVPGQAAGNANQSNPQPTAMGAAYQGAAQQQSFTAAPAAQSAPMGGMRRALGRVGSPMSRTPTSEALVQLTEVLTKEYNASPDLKSFDWELIPLDYTNTTNINASSLLFLISSKSNPAGGGGAVGYHALVIEADSAQNMERTEQFAGQSYDVQKTTGDLVDAVMTDFFEQKVRAAHPNQPIYYADACVVPRDFDINDKKLVHALAANAAAAAWNEVQIRDKDFEYLNLAYARDNSLQVRTTYNQPETIDTLGQPLRADVAIDFRSVPTATTSQLTDNVDRVENFSRAGGFIELTYDPVSDPMNAYMQAITTRRPEDSQLYSARLVLTQLDSLDSVNNAMQLLALSTAFPLLEQTQPWMQNFLPPHLAATATSNRLRTSSFDPRDIGALNYEAKMKDANGNVDRIDTTTSEFTAQSFFILMTTLVRPGIALSLDVPECGDSTWYNRIFLASRNRQGKAYSALIAAANALTDNHFSQFFNATSGFIVLDQDDRVHMGYYTDSEGVKHDVRNIDLLYMLNRFGATDSSIGRQWTETFTNTMRPLNVNLAIRRQMIEACVGNVVFTGFARRLTFHSDLIRSLDQAINASGMHVRVVTQGADTRSFQRAASGLANAGALNANFQSASFDRAYSSGAPGGGYRPANTPNRW